MSAGAAIVRSAGELFDKSVDREWCRYPRPKVMRAGAQARRVAKPAASTRLKAGVDKRIRSAPGNLS